MKILVIASVAFLFGTIPGWIGSHHHSVKAAEMQQTIQASKGRPMKYAEVPIGHWRVIFVVDKSTQTAVIEKDTEAPPYTHEPKQYLLVYDMMPQMMEENFTFTKSGSQ